MRQKRTKYGLYSVAIFIVFGFILFTITSYFRNSHFLSPLDVFINKDLWYWWIIWSGLLFYCGYSIRKEYEMILFGTKNEFPELNDKTLIKEVRQEFFKIYAKRLSPFFALLPIAYIATLSPTLSESSTLFIIILLSIPTLALILYKIIHQN